MNASKINQGISRRAALLEIGAGAVGVALTRGGMIASAQEGTPSSHPSHPAAGVWRWTNYPGERNSDFSYGILTETGTYADAWYGRLVSVGEWRATGDHSADLVIVTRELILLDDLFGDADVVVPADVYEAKQITLWRLALEFDETGNQFTATGTSESQDADGAVLDNAPYTGLGERMTLVAGTAVSS